MIFDFCVCCIIETDLLHAPLLAAARRCSPLLAG